MADEKSKDWRQLARKASKEKDPKKLLAIIEELNAVLEERENQWRSEVSKPVHASSSRTEQIGKRLLFVDDEPNIRMTLPPILRKHGFEVRVAASVAEAVAEIQSNNFDVLVSDLNIVKEGDGFAVIHAMREANPKCVTILLTGYPAFETAQQAIHAEVDDYFVKPAEIESLVSTIQRKLQSRRSS